MYSPLTGFSRLEYERNRSFYDLMRINPIEMPSHSRPKASEDAAASANNYSQPAVQKVDKQEEEQASMVINNHYNIDNNNNMSLQDFFELRAEFNKDEPYAMLDVALEKMKENSEQIDKILDAVLENTEENTEKKLALSLIKQTR